MSYILNALRKSERERQALEPDAVTDRIVIHQPPRHQSSAKLIAALVVINLVFLVYFFRSTQQTLPEAPQAVAPLVNSEEVSRAEISSTPRATTRPAATQKPPIGDVGTAAPPGKPAAVTKQPEPDKSVSAQPRPVMEQAAAIAPVKAVAVKKLPVEPVKPELASPRSDQRPLEPAKDAIEKPLPVAAPAPIPLQAKDDLPFLEDLPADFRRSLPDLPINVFSYSSTAAERFVMIGMVKYVPGQRIKDLLELKEIRPDCIVVSYDDRTFKIKRP
jgi:general secretion pathway protein B